MKRVEVAEQVAEFVRTQAPDPRKALRMALRNLMREQGDIKALEGPLTNYWRLRVGGYRVVFAYARGGKTIRCIFAERRSLVYEVFEKLLEAKLLGGAGE
jgi:mRNA-degrading endonuclease RelE of RelBE toxin-antitoxin system